MRQSDNIHNNTHTIFVIKSTQKQRLKRQTACHARQTNARKGSSFLQSPIRIKGRSPPSSSYIFSLPPKVVATSPRSLFCATTSSRSFPTKRTSNMIAMQFILCCLSYASVFCHKFFTKHTSATFFTMSLYVFFPKHCHFSPPYPYQSHSHQPSVLIRFLYCIIYPV